MVVDVKVYNSSDTTDYQYESVTVNTLNSVDLLTFNNVLILEEGDIIKMQTPTGNKIKMTRIPTSQKDRSVSALRPGSVMSFPEN